MDVSNIGAPRNFCLGGGACPKKVPHKEKGVAKSYHMMRKAPNKEKIVPTKTEQIKTIVKIDFPIGGGRTPTLAPPPSRRPWTVRLTFRVDILGSNIMHYGTHLLQCNAM